MSAHLTPWSPHKSVSETIRGASVIPSSAAALSIFGIALFIWVSNRGGLSATITIALQVPLILSIGKIQARVPRSAKLAEYDSRALAFLSQTMKVPQPSMRVAERSDESVRIRGTSAHPIIYISPRSLLAWKRDPTVHAVQLSHEMGHVWARDLGRYYFLSSGVLLLTLEVFPILPAVRTPGRILIATTTITALLSLRYFLRSREHAADLLAAQVLGASARDALPNTDVSEDRLPRLLRAHPSPRRRRQVFGHPELLFLDLKIPMFAFGYSSIFALDMTTAFYRTLVHGGTRTLPLQIVLLPATLLMAAVFGRLLAIGAALAPVKIIRSWFRGFFFGALTCLLVLTTPPGIFSVAFACVIVALILAKFIALLSQGVFWLFGKAGDDFDVSGNRIAQSVLPAVAWAGFVELYYFHWYAPIADFVTRI